MTLCRGGDGAGGGNRELGSRGAGLTAACWLCGELVDLSPVPSSVQAELLSPPKADLRVSDELFHSTSTITFALHHREDAARALGTFGALQPGGGQRGLPKVGLSESSAAAPAEVFIGFRVSLPDAAC